MSGRPRAATMLATTVVVWTALVAVAVVAAVLALAGAVPAVVGWVMVSAPFVAVAVFDPTTRRLAMRNLRRRPKEAILIVLGALLGTAMVTGGLLIQHSVSASLTARVDDRLGVVDEIVTTAGSPSGALVASRLTSQPPSGVAGVLPLLSTNGAAFTTGADARADPHTQLVEVDFAAARRFGDASLGDAAATPTGSLVAVSAALATTLGLHPGDLVNIAVYGQERAFSVSVIVAERGVGGFGTSLASTPANVFLPLGTLDALLANANAASPAALPTALTLVRNTPVPSQPFRVTSAAVSAQVTSALAGLPATVTPLRKQLTAAATSGAAGATGTISIATVMCAIAGTLLLVNTFVMLAQERKRQSGMLRAIGMRRIGLVNAYAFEGWMYSVVAAMIGVGLGVGVAKGALGLSGGLLGARTGAADPALRLSITASILSNAFTVGLLTSLLTVTAAAVWASRLNIIRAVRDVPEPMQTGTRTRIRWIAIALAALGSALTVVGAVSSSAILLIVGPVFLAIGLHPLAARVAPRRWVSTVLAGGVIVWCLEASTIATGAFRQAATVVYVVEAVALAGAGVALFAAHQVRLASFLGGRRRPRLALRLGLAYPLARKGRTAMVLGIYVLEVMMLALALGIASFGPSQLARTANLLGNGAAITVTSNPATPIAATDISSLSGISHVTTLRTGTAAAALTAGGAALTTVPLAASDETIWAHGAPPLSKRAAAYTTDAAVYDAVRVSTNLIIVNFDFLPGLPGAPAAAAPGQHVVLRNPATGQEMAFTIVGVQGDVPGSPAVHDFVSPAVLDALAGDRAGSLLFLTTAAGADVHAIAGSINATYARSGADAQVLRDLAGAALGDRARYFNFLGGLVTVGVLIGVVALGVVMVRSVRERRREIGTIRAIGWSRRGVRAVFLAEAGVLATQGTVLGIFLGTILAYRIGSGTSVSLFVVPWWPLAAVTALTILASLAAAARPAAAASRIPPAAALRSAE